jgi:hypothetical protein
MLKATAPPFPAIYGCNLSGGSPIVFFDFVLLMLLETGQLRSLPESYFSSMTRTKVIVVMTTYRVYRKFRHSTDPTIVTLYRDGIFFFICLFGKFTNFDTNVYLRVPSDWSGQYIGFGTGPRK